MTYNFDPDKWYENELFVISSKYESGRMTKEEYEKLIERLDQKHTKMWNRLDGSYQLPK